MQVPTKGDGGVKINSGEIIKKIRIDIGISQEEMADRLFISPRKLSRIEAEDAKIDIWQLMSMLELLGYPSEDFWVLYLDSDEFSGYRLYKRLKRQLRNDEFDDARATMDKLSQNALAKQSFVGQFLALVEVILDNDITHDVAIERCEEIIKMSIPNFDETKISEYRLTYNEIYTITELSTRLSKIGQKDRAIAITEAVIESRENSRTSEEDRAKLFPALLFNLSNYLGQSGKIKEALKVCSRAIEVCREYNNLKFVPEILFNMAYSYHALGEQEQVYKIQLVRAYHCAYAMGENETAKLIKKYAEEDFGISEL